MGIEMALSSPGIAILFEHSEWFQPLFAEFDRCGNTAVKGSPREGREELRGHRRN